MEMVRTHTKFVTIWIGMPSILLNKTCGFTTTVYNFTYNFQCGSNLNVTALSRVNVFLLQHHGFKCAFVFFY